MRTIINLRDLGRSLWISIKFRIRVVVHAQNELLHLLEPLSLLRHSISYRHLFISCPSNYKPLNEISLNRELTAPIHFQGQISTGISGTISHCHDEKGSI
jgi:hypothetical protein